MGRESIRFRKLKVPGEESGDRQENKVTECSGKSNSLIVASTALCTLYGKVQLVENFYVYYILD